MILQRYIRIAFLALFCLTATAIVALALTPSPPALGIGDKIEHVVAFGCLSLLSLIAFPKQRKLVLALALATLGALIECLQLLPALRRSSDGIDWIADCAAIGIVFGSAAAMQRLEGWRSLASTRE